MKKSLLNILLLLILNAVGLYTLPLLIVLTIKFGMLPQPPAGPLLHRFSVALTVIGPWLSIPAALLSIAGCFNHTEVRLWLWAAPVYVPAIYMLLLLTYFHFAI